MGCVQWDGDRHGDARSQSLAVHPGQAEAVEQAKALHVTVAPRVAVVDGAGGQGQQQKKRPRRGRHCILKERIRAGYFEVCVFCDAYEMFQNVVKCFPKS